MCARRQAKCEPINQFHTFHSISKELFMFLKYADSEGDEVFSLCFKILVEVFCYEWTV